MSNTQVNNRLLYVLIKLLAHHVQREKAYKASQPQTDAAYWELDKQAQAEFLAKQSSIDWETTPWERAISFLSDVFLIVVPKGDLRVHVVASKIGLDGGDPLSVELARLDSEGVTDKLLNVIQDEFPGEWIDLKLPVPSNLQHDKTSIAGTVSEIAPQLTNLLIKHVEALVTTPDADDGQQGSATTTQIAANDPPSIPVSAARAMMDDGAVEIMKIASDTTKSANDRMDAILRIDICHIWKTSEEWHDLMPDVTASAIRQTAIWKQREVIRAEGKMPT